MKYPKLTMLLIIFVLIYFLFKDGQILPLRAVLFPLGYLGILLAGIFYAYGFTAAPATAVLLILSKETNLALAGLVGGLGALIGDFLIFKFIRSGFDNEIKKLSKEKFFIFFGKITPRFIKKYFLPVVGSFVLASPLPDEVGVILIAADRKISNKKFSIISYVLNTVGIFIILLLGK